MPHSLFHISIYFGPESLICVVQGSEDASSASTQNDESFENA